MSSNRYKEVIEHTKQKNTFPQYKFKGLSLPEAVELITKHYPGGNSFFSFTDREDFQFPIEGMCQIMAALPVDVTTLSLNIYYLLRMAEENVVKLIQARPVSVTCLLFDYIGRGEPDMKSVAALLALLKQHLPGECKIAHTLDTNTHVEQACEDDDLFGGLEDFSPREPQENTVSSSTIDLEACSDFQPYLSLTKNKL